MPLNTGSEYEYDYESRLVAAEEHEEDAESESCLRPKTMDDFVGQRKVKDNLSIFIAAAKERGDSLDHVLLHGPAGLGKTTLSMIIASELGVSLKVTSGPAVEKGRDLAALLTTLGRNDILFIDEIHRLSRQVEEVLYSAMEDFTLDLMMGKGPAARSIRIPLKPFTLIGATTRAGQLSAPLRDRFGMNFRLEMYSPEDLAKIIKRSASILGIEATPEGALEIARCSRGTPRVANRLLKRVRDFAQVKGSGVIDTAAAQNALHSLDIDELGLDSTDRRMLTAIIKHFGGGPVGLETLAAITGEESVTLEDVYEPYLLRLGFINRTPRGRCATADAYRHLGFAPPTEAPAATFAAAPEQTKIFDE